MDHQKTKKMKKRAVEEQPLSEDMDQKKLKKTDSEAATEEEEYSDTDLDTPEVKPPTEDGSIKCNPFTFGMLALEFYLCKSCRGYLAGRKVFPKKDNADVYFLIKMCQQCRELNQKMRDCFKDTMKKDWPSNSNFA